MTVQHISQPLAKVLKDQAGVNGLKLENIPATLRTLNQWVMWRMASRNDKPTKIPLQGNGDPASSTDPKTWLLFEQAEASLMFGRNFDGIGFVFVENGGLVGIDLDGCRDPRTGKVEDWAREIVLKFGTYAEVSPTQTGVKLFVAGKSPFEKGRKELVDAKLVCDKPPGIEIYDRGRYFAVTGWRLAGVPHEPVENAEALTWLKDRYFKDVIDTPVQSRDFNSTDAIVERARKYIAKIPGAVSGQRGHDATFHVACVLVCDFALDEDTAYGLLCEWNQTCVPPWSEKELIHKIDSANQQPGERGRLRFAKPERWNTIPLPPRKAPPPKTEATVITIADAGRRYLEYMKSGNADLLQLGIGDVDAALDGGVARDEYIAIAARPSHGKSMVGMQIVHQWASVGISSFVASADMSELSMGKRLLHFISDCPENEWKHRVDELENTIAEYERSSAKCHMVSELRSVDEIADQIENAIDKHGVQAAIVDYVQLLNAPGGNKAEQVAYSSGVFKSLAKRRRIPLLLLCQMNRAIEMRKKFIPIMSDIEHSARIEQDANVVMFLVWPWRINKQLPKNQFQIWIAKNQNRAINESLVECRLFPHRQMVLPIERPQNPHAGDFDEFNERNERKDLA